MKFDPQIHKRRSIRLKGYDYSQLGAYFVTICVNKKICLFGHIVDNKMILNDPGKMVVKIWSEIPQFYPGVAIDEHSVMPNHLHGIIILKNRNAGASHCGRPIKNPQNDQSYSIPGQTQGPDPTVDPTTQRRLTLGDVVGRFESFTTHKYIDGVKNFNWEPFYKKLWQRNYFEHIIRNNKDLFRIRKYTIENSTKWDKDKENPKNREYNP